MKRFYSSGGVALVGDDGCLLELLSTFLRRRSAKNTQHRTPNTHRSSCPPPPS